MFMTNCGFTIADSREHVDMAMVYRQSLFSPMYGALNFRTPVYKANKNRYKMVERSAWHLPRYGVKLSLTFKM